MALVGLKRTSRCACSLHLQMHLHAPVPFEASQSHTASRPHIIRLGRIALLSAKRWTCSKASHLLSIH